jgi:thiamine-monophosphate kinase
MIDVSDGWRADLGHLCRASRLRAVIDQPPPRTSAMEEAAGLLGVSLERWRFGPSDDYELLFTVSPSDWTKIERLCASLDIPLTRLGTMSTGGPEVTFTDSLAGAVEIADARLRRGAGGWDHFGPERPRSR